VRIGQHQGAYPAGQRRLQFKINYDAVRCQRELHKVDSCLRQFIEEWGIRRGGECHLLTWLNQYAAHLDQSRHDVWDQRDLILVDTPAEPPSSESGERRRQPSFPRRGVAKIMSVDRGVQRRCDLRS
jgi:hypothetical protein